MVYAWCRSPRHWLGALALLAPVAAVASGDPAVGPPRLLAAGGGWASCRFAGPEFPGGPVLVGARFNQDAFAHEIVRLPLDGGAPEVLAYGREPDVRGSVLVWVGSEPGEEGVWRRDLAGDERPTRLYGGTDMTRPSLAADGRTVACTYQRNNQSGIFLLRHGGEKPERLVFRQEHTPAYSREGERMLAIKYDQIWLMSARRWEEVVATRLTEGIRHDDPAWGPRGEWITFAGGLNPEDARVGLMRLSSGRITWPETRLQGVRSPVISGDGALLAFVAGQGTEAAIYLCDLRLPE